MKTRSVTRKELEASRVVLPLSANDIKFSKLKDDDRAIEAVRNTSAENLPTISYKATSTTKKNLKRSTASHSINAPKKTRKGKKSQDTVPTDNEILPHGLGRLHFPKGPSTAIDTVTRELVYNQLQSGEVKVEQFQASQALDSLRPSVIDIPAAQSALDDTHQVQTFKSLGYQDVVVTDCPASAANPRTPGDQVAVKKSRVARKTKENPYGLMPGRTPFPEWSGPSAEECKHVHDILTEMHGIFRPPTKVSPPSTTIAGCGEVPDLVDAMMRTLISGHTTMANANLAIQDVIAKYGQWDTDSVGAGSIDWDKVRRSEEPDIVDAVKRAGLGITKGKDIKLILQQVYEENQQRRIAYLQETETGIMSGLLGAGDLTQGQKDHQILKIEEGVLTLDHIRCLSSQQAMVELTRYPGIGVKTASCLILFCLQQPSFAVDTHVWRLSKWLRWVPPKASRDDTYMHCELRVPDHLKYGLHQLLIRHGKECTRCRASTMKGTSEWETTVCPLEDLVDRFDKREAKKPPKTQKDILETSEDHESFIEQNVD